MFLPDHTISLSSHLQMGIPVVASPGAEMLTPQELMPTEHLASHPPHRAVSEKTTFLPSNDSEASEDESPSCAWSLWTVTPGSDPCGAGGIRARLRQKPPAENLPLAMVLKLVFLS